MSIRAAATINRPEDVVRATLPEAEEPLRSAEVSYAAAPGDRGTEVRAVLDRSVPGGALGQKLASVIGAHPQQKLDDALRRFKQVLEAGEVTRSNALPTGTDARVQRTQSAAQPGEE